MMVSFAKLLPSDQCAGGPFEKNYKLVESDLQQRRVWVAWLVSLGVYSRYWPAVDRRHTWSSIHYVNSSRVLIVLIHECYYL